MVALRFRTDVMLDLLLVAVADLLLLSQLIHAELIGRLMSPAVAQSGPSAVGIASGALLVVGEPAAAEGPRFDGEDLLKGQPEVQIEDGIDDGVEGAVGVAEPGEYFEDDGRDAGLAESGHDVDAEERDPADQEDAHDDAQRDGRLVVRDVVAVLAGG